MDESWREIYALSSMIEERHLRTGAKSRFLEPPVARLRPASPVFDADWKEKLHRAPSAVDDAEPVQAFG